MKRRTRKGQSTRDNLRWAKVQANGTYAELGHTEGRQLLTTVFRSLPSQPPREVFSDQQLFDGTMELIRHGLLEVWFALDGTTLHVRSDFRGAA
ncbi:hypothetical protein ACVMB3_001168 [Sinorhizobium meliloti]